MSEQNLQTRLEQGISGAPQLKPDEKRKYLGNFKERLYLVLTFEEAQNSLNFPQIKKTLLAYPHHQLFLNSQLPSDTQKKLIQLAKETDCTFTVVDTTIPHTQTDIAAVYAGKEPSGIASIYLTKETSSSTVKTEKKSWFQKLFSTNN